MAFKLSLVADVRGWLKGTADVQQSLDDVADGLDDLARDTKANADQAADDLERSFSDAFDKVKRETKTTSKKLGDDLKDGTREAGEGFYDLKDEANQSAKEAAASFSGEFEDVADYIQEVLAQALSGFGPVGAAAGLAAAAGIGILVAGLQESAEKAEEAQQKVADLAAELADVKGNPALIDHLSRMQELVGSIVDKKEWFEFWQPKNITWIEQQDRLWRDSNITLAQRNDLLRAQVGDTESTQRALATLNAEIEREQRNATSWTDTYGVLHHEASQREQDLTKERDALQQTSQAADEARRQYEAVAAADRKRAQAIQAAQESDERFAESLRDNGTVLDDFAAKIVKGGKIVYSEWTKLREKMRSDNKIIMDVDADPRLSPAAKENFRNLPRDVQTAIAKEFKRGGKHDDKVIKELNADAKVKVGKIDVQTPNVKPVEIPTTVADAGAVKGAQEAADTAQRVANREHNKIEFKTKVDDDGLQAAVNRAAAAIRPPTVWVNVKAKKEVP